MVVNRENGKIEHKHFYDIVDRLREGDCLVIEQHEVIPHGFTERRGSGGKIESCFKAA